MWSQTYTLRGTPGLWRPEEGELYFTILADGNVRQLPWHGTPFDYDAWQFGNCFRKRAEAQHARAHIQELLLMFHEQSCRPSSGQRPGSHRTLRIRPCPPQGERETPVAREGMAGNGAKGVDSGAWPGAHREGYERSPAEQRARGARPCL
jgi:hypothetical protein